MNRNYPIVATRALPPVPPRGFMRRRVRDPSELPHPAAHEVLVYRVHGQFIVDAGVRRASDDQVTEASYVSVVDISEHAPVLVELKVRSADTTDFIVHVTFRCTVTDPALIVERGLTDARGFLSEYLRSMPDVFEMGQDYQLAELNKVQRSLSAFITSAVLHDPPVRPGMRIALAGVQVLTPQEVEEFEVAQRYERYGYEKDALKAILDARLAGIKQENDNRYKDRELEHELRSATRTEMHARDLEAGRVDSRLETMRKYADAMGSDPELAVVLAMSSGELGAVDAAQMLLERAERRERAEREAMRVRATHDYQLLRTLIESDAGEFAQVDREKLNFVLDKMIDNIARNVDGAPAAELGPSPRELPDEEGERD